MIGVLQVAPQLSWSVPPPECNGGLAILVLLLESRRFRNRKSSSPSPIASAVNTLSESIDEMLNAFAAGNSGLPTVEGLRSVTVLSKKYTVVRKVVPR
jgi:hypothetical protein